ncbi:MAG: GNAT family N-acetyltransferase [Micropruina sp.]|nr:GNAT family N-acetyltransferase [Micropruina sp.]
MIRPAQIADLPDVLRLIRELAEYEREPDAAVATIEDLHAALFPEGTAHIFCDLVEDEGQVVGMALWFLNFSTWTGQCGIYLEDLFIQPSHRGFGFGKALLAHLANRCLEQGYPRLVWQVLDWNTPSIEFYRSLGAESMDEWITMRVTGDALGALAAQLKVPSSLTRNTST